MRGNFYLYVDVKVLSTTSPNFIIIVIVVKTDPGQVKTYDDVKYVFFWCFD